MTIVYLAVNNFRGLTGGLSSNRIEFKDSNTLFILGQNNTGKSTFLEAYDFFYSNSGPLKTDFYRQDQTTPIEFEIEVELDSHDQDQIEKSAPKQKESYKKYLSDANTIKLRNTWKGLGKTADNNSATWNPTESVWDMVGYASVGLHSVFQSCLPKPIFIKAMPTEEEAKKVLNEILKSVAEGKLNQKELEELVPCNTY